MLHVINPNTARAAIVLPVMSDLTDYDYTTGTVKTIISDELILALLLDIHEQNINEVSCCDVAKFHEIGAIYCSTELEDDVWVSECFEYGSFLKDFFNSKTVWRFISSTANEETYNFLNSIQQWFDNDELKLQINVFLSDIIHTRTYVDGREVSIASVAVPLRQIRDVLQEQFDSIDRIDHPDTEEFTATIEMIFSLVDSLIYKAGNTDKQ